MAAGPSLLETQEFKELRSQKNTISTVLSILMLVIYYGFILLIAFFKPVINVKMVGNVTMGIFMGLGVIIASCVLTGIYVWWANSRYDAMVERIKSRMGG